MIFRSLLLLLPLGLWAALFVSQRLSTREMTASFLGFVWAFQACLIINILSLKSGYWHFTSDANLFYDLPLDWLLGQAVIIGALIPLTRLWNWNLAVHLLIQAIVIPGLYFSTRSFLLDTSAASWILLILLFSAVPATLLSNWTARDSHIPGRAWLQALAWAGLLFWLFPSIVLFLTGDDWNALVQRDLVLNGIYLLPMLIPGYLLTSALYQFAVAGGGTAFPYDPPKRLVVSGVYSYLSNPMQLGICLAMAWWGVVINSGWIVLSALIALLLFVVFKDVCNGSFAIGEGNQQWRDYQDAVPKWWPRLKPWGPRDFE